MQGIHVKGKRKLGAAENKHLRTCIQQPVCGGTDLGRIKVGASGLDALVDHIHDRSLPLVIRRYQLYTAVFKAALINTGLHRAVCRKQTCAAHTLTLKCLHCKLYHVQDRYRHSVLHLGVKVVSRVAGHDE